MLWRGRRDDSGESLQMSGKAAPPLEAREEQREATRRSTGTLGLPSLTACGEDSMRARRMAESDTCSIQRL